MEIEEEVKGPQTREPHESMIKSDSIDIEQEYAAARQVVGHDIEEDDISEDSDYQDDDDGADSLPEKLKNRDPSQAFNAGAIEKDDSYSEPESFQKRQDQMSEDDDDYSEVGEMEEPSRKGQFDASKVQASSEDDYSEPDASLVEEKKASPPKTKVQAGNKQQKE